MSDISNQLIKDSYNYVLQSDLSTGVVYRIGGTIPVNPIFQSGLTVNSGFTYSNGTEQPGYALLTDGTGYAYWGSVSAATPVCFQYLTDESGNFILDENGEFIVTETTDCYGVLSLTTGIGLSGNSTTGNITLINTAPDQTVTISGGTGIITGGIYPNFTITNNSPDQTVTITGGTNIEIIGTYPNFGVNFTGTTTGSTIIGDYLPLSGGTVTGVTEFQSGLTVNSGFTYSNGTEQPGYVLFTDGTGHAFWGPITATTQCFQYLTDESGNFILDENGDFIITETTDCFGVTSIIAGIGLSGSSTTGNVTLINTAPDQTVTITGGTNIQITGTYPDFGVNYTGSSTSVQGITGITGTSGVSATTNDYGTTIINTAPDQTVTISGGTGITTGGTYPNFTLVNSAPDRTVTVTGGTNIQITGTYPDFGVNYTGTTIIQGITGITGTSGVSASTTDYGTTIINTAPDRTVTITGGTNIQITGSYPDFGVNFTGTTTGDYLPLSGGTVTGKTIFQSGLTANTFYSSGQVGIGTSNPNAAAIIEIASTTQGVLFPRMTKVQRDAISTPPIGLMLFVTDDNEGLYIYKTSGWVQII